MVPFPLVNLTVMAFSYPATSFLRDGCLFSQPGLAGQLDKLTGKVFREDLVSGQLAAAPRQQAAGSRQGRRRLNTVIISELYWLCPAYLLPARTSKPVIEHQPTPQANVSLP